MWFDSVRKSGNRVLVVHSNNVAFTIRIKRIELFEINQKVRWVPPEIYVSRYLVYAKIAPNRKTITLFF